MSRTRWPTLLLVSLLTLAPTLAEEDPGTEERSGYPAGVIAVASYSMTMDFFNKPQGNRFVLSERGRLVSHVQSGEPGDLSWLKERQVEERGLDRAILGGNEIPVDFVRMQMPSLFGKKQGFEREVFSPRTQTYSDLQAIERVLKAQYADDTVIRALGRLCQRDWRRIAELARGETVLTWSLPALYHSLTFAQEEVDAQRTRITITASGQGTGVTGPRQLDEFRFVGVHDTARDRFVHLDVRGTIENTERELQMKVSYAEQRLEPQAEVPAGELQDYQRVVNTLADALDNVAQRQHSAALAAWESLASTPGIDRFRTTGQAYFAKVKRVVEGIQWSWQPGALEQALTRAETEKKPLLVLFDQENCPPCQMLHRTVLTQPEFVEAVQDRFLTVNLDFCRASNLVERYALRGTPTLLILDSEGQVLASQVGVTTLRGALRWLEGGLEKFLATAAAANKSSH